MNDTAYEIRLRSWIDAVYEANSSGMSKKDWCEMNGISTRSFYYWQDKVRRYLAETELSDESAIDTIPVRDGINFVDITDQLTVKDSPADVVRNAFEPDAVLVIGKYKLYIGKTTSRDTITKVMKAAANA